MEVTIAYRGEEGATVYVFDETGERIRGALDIDIITYEIIFGLHEIRVMRCDISENVFDRLMKIAELQYERGC